MYCGSCNTERIHAYNRKYKIFPVASLHQLPIYYYSKATTAEVGTNPTQKGLPPETDPAFIVKRLANPNNHFNKFTCTCKLKCATLHWLHNNQNKNYTLKHITNYNKLHPRFLYLLALFVLPVCVCVCRREYMYVVGNGWASFQPSTEHRISFKVTSMSIHMLPALEPHFCTHT